MKHKLPLSRYMLNKTRIVWDRMHARCSDPTHTAYQYYGGKGIKVCKRWKSFARFLADMGPKPGTRTLERLNTDADYKPSNCQWSSVREKKTKPHPPGVPQSTKQLTSLLKASVRTLKKRHR